MFLGSTGWVIFELWIWIGYGTKLGHNISDVAEITAENTEATL